MIIKRLLIAFLCTTLLACASHRPLPGGTENLNQLQELTSTDSSTSRKASILAVRNQALSDTAMSLAAQSGLAARSKQINQMLEKEDKLLRQAFNFNGLVLSNNVLPPVLVESRDELNIADGNTIRIADRTYEIASQARFVTAPPNWREYLWMDFQAPPRPDNTLLPKTSSERAAWREAVAKGWTEGFSQADVIYVANLARLKRDYEGMLLYRKLLAQKMVSPPYVARTRLGVTGDKSKLRINDQVLRITELPGLQTDSSTWAPAFNRKPTDAATNQ